MDEPFEAIMNSILAYSNSNTINIEFKESNPFSYSTITAPLPLNISNLVNEASQLCHIPLESCNIRKKLKLFTLTKDIHSYEQRTLYNLMLYYDTLQTQDSIFVSPDKRDEYKTEQMLNLKEVIRMEEGEKIQYFLNISIIEAKGLKSKAKKGLPNNTFVRLYYDGIVYTSLLFNNSLDPRYNLDVSLPVRDINKAIHVSVWLDKESNPEENGAFLGSCIIGHDDSYSWVTLGKRSGRSHVSGKILVSVKNIKPFKDVLVSYPILKFIPAKAEILYEQVARSMLSKNYDQLQKGIEIDHSRLISLLEKTWRISNDLRVGILFDEAIEMFARGKLSAVFYKNTIHDDVIRQYKSNRYISGNVRNVANNLIRFRKVCEVRVKGFFNSIDDIKTPDQLKVLPELMSSIDLVLEKEVESSSAFAAKIESLLEKSVHSRYKDLLDKADFKEPITFDRLMKLLDVLVDELKDLKINYNFILLDTINVSYLCCHLYLRQLVQILEDFPNIFQSGRITMAEGFEIYTKSLKFGDLCLSVDAGFKSFLDFSYWFTPLIHEWFKASENKMVEWTKNAINLDKFQQNTPFEPSTSLSDVLTFLQQQIDFIFSLEWRDKAAKTLMTEKLYQNIAAVFIKYAQILSEMVVTDFKSFSPTAFNVMKKPNAKKRIKFKIKLKNGKKPLLNPGELRLMPEMLVKIVNISNLCRVFKSLKPGNFELFQFDIPDGSEEDLFGQTDRCMFELNVLNALEVQISRPYNTTVSIRITDSNGTFIGQTSKKIQNIIIKWNETFYGFVISPDKKIRLFFEVIQTVPDTSKEYFFARGKVELDFASKESNIVKLGPFGKIEFGISVIRSFNQEFSECLISQNANYNIDKMKDLIAEQICHDFKEKFKKSILYKQSPLRTMLSNVNSILQKNESLEEATDDNLSFFLEFFNTNFDVLTDIMEEKLAFKVIQAVWDKMIKDLESLLVPNLHSDNVDKALDEKQVLAIQNSFNNFATFFHGEGSGLPSTSLKTPRAIQLKLIIDNYNKSKSELNQKYVTLNQESDVFNEKEGVLPTDWILKLLKLKGHLDMVEKGLKARSNRFILKTLSDSC